MNYAIAAPDLERLPWLTDDRRPARQDDIRPLVLWSGIAAVLIAGASYWMGMNSLIRMPDAIADASSATITLPLPLIADLLEEDMEALEVPVVRDESATAVTSRASGSQLRAMSKAAIDRPPAAVEAAANEDAPQPQEAQLDAPKPLTLWSAYRSTDAEGKIVRIGTFASSRQAKIGWRQIVRTYPGMGRLQAVVVAKPSLRDGQTYYRLQFGTTSQAHSEVLCQWMKSIGQSCIVVGLSQESSA